MICQLASGSVLRGGDPPRPPSKRQDCKTVTCAGKIAHEQKGRNRGEQKLQISTQRTKKSTNPAHEKEDRPVTTIKNERSDRPKETNGDGYKGDVK